MTPIFPLNKFYINIYSSDFILLSCNIEKNNFIVRKLAVYVHVGFFTNNLSLEKKTKKMSMSSGFNFGAKCCCRFLISIFCKIVCVLIS